MAKGVQSPRQSRYWLLTSPRTASNLLVKILNLNEQGVRPARHGGYFFLPAIPNRFSAPEAPISTWTEQERTGLNTVIQQCLERFEDHIDAAEQEGQIIYVKEHSIMLNHPSCENEYLYGSGEAQTEVAPLQMRDIVKPTRSPLNLTLFPDEFLKTWSPTFLIRHPALMMASLYRTCLSDLDFDGFKRPNKEPMQSEVTMKWQRTLYDFYAEHYANDSIWPIVIDADDVMTCPQLVVKYAQLSGLDETKVRFSWDKLGEQESSKLNHLEKRMLSSINASTAIDKSKVAGQVDIDQEVVKWTSEFGEEGARKLERWVRDAMPDYEFLHSKRLRLEQE